MLIVTALHLSDPMLLGVQVKPNDASLLQAAGILRPPEIGSNRRRKGREARQESPLKASRIAATRARPGRRSDLAGPQREPVADSGASPEVTEYETLPSVSSHWVPGDAPPRMAN